MSGLTLGALAGTRKENERRLALHPQHLPRIDASVRERIFLEHGYGERFGVSDEQLATQVGGLRSREQLIAETDIVLLPKPMAADLAELREGQVLWGWPHCVQDDELAQQAIDRKLTLIAFEAMNHWTRRGDYALHVFHKNNELAGYASVLHALQLTGRTGVYGPKLRAAVIGFGATARGAVTALNAHGVRDIDILTARGVAAVAAPMHSANLLRIDHDDENPQRSQVLGIGGQEPLASFLAQHDIVVNCSLQNPEAPLMFLLDEDLRAFTPGSLIIDVSCDEGMGFSWAKPTTFEEPTFTVGEDITYYGVDHTPSLLWNSATWEISEAVLPHLDTVLGGPRSWEADETVRRAIEIRDGVIQNPAILSFQNRMPDYPHSRQ